MSQVNWILGLVVLLLILFIAFAIFVIYYSLKAEAQANATIAKLQTEFVAANDKINTLSNQLTPILTEIGSVINTINDDYIKHKPLIDLYICKNYPILAPPLGINCGS